MMEALEVARVPYPSGMTAICRVEVADGESRLGADDLGCDCEPPQVATRLPTVVVYRIDATRQACRNGTPR